MVEVTGTLTEMAEARSGVMSTQPEFATSSSTAVATSESVGGVVPHWVRTKKFLDVLSSGLRRAK
tara:strand:- start:408 stop:602 length:195 start_codon:yes stop_codon:yes gene_type:complete